MDKPTDTQRLDWIEKNKADITTIQFGEPWNVKLSTGKPGISGYRWSGKTLREAIDQAIQGTPLS